MLEVPELISSTAILYAIIPCVYAIFDPSAASITWAVVVLATPFAVKLIKAWTIQYPYSEFRRPQGARNCNMLMNNGDQSGAAGFPSGHVATAAAFWAGAWMLAGHWAAVVGVLATTAMAWARMQMRCHSGLQTVVGAVLGTLVGAGAVGAAAAAAKK